MQTWGENRLKQSEFLVENWHQKPIRKAFGKSNFRFEDARYAPQQRGKSFNQEGLYQQTLEELRTLLKAIRLEITDPYELTDLIFYARHPQLKGVALTQDQHELREEWNSINNYLVHPTLNEFIGRNETAKPGVDSNFSSHRFENTPGLNGYPTKYDSIIQNAVGWFPGLSPLVLKSLLAQESNFRPRVINQYGYAGIAQFGRAAAREVGLKMGLVDERLIPDKAIPGAAKLLKIKAQRLDSIAFSNFGKPTGTNYWKFVLAAYNGGEGTVSVAMGHAYRRGLAFAREKGLNASEAINFARRYATDWENLKVGGINSPLGLATSRFFPRIATEKYYEIGNYPTQIINRINK